MMGGLHADIFFQDRYMLNEVNVNILIKLVRSKDASLLRHVPSRLQSDDQEDRDVREKSQAVAVGILGTRQGVGKRYGKISN